MNRAKMLLKDKEIIDTYKKNVIFLDIDGVIQPYDNNYRFKHDLNGTVNYLTNRYRDNSYKNMDKYDVCAAFYDWDEIGLGILKKIIYEYDAHIVLHSGWREYMSLIEAKALFRLYDLEQDLIGICDKGNKETAIKEYLEENKNEIDKYVVIDDALMVNDFGYHFVHTNNVLNMNNYAQICNILNNYYSFILDKDNIIVKKNDNEIVEIPSEVKDIVDKKILFIDFSKIYKYANSYDYLAISNELTHIANEKDLFGIAIKAKNTDECFNLIEKQSIPKINFNIDSVMYYIPIENNSFKAYNFYNDNKYVICDALKNINFKE